MVPFREKLPKPNNMKMLRITVLLCLFMVCVFVCVAFLTRRRAFQIRQYIRSMDHPALLAECRSLIENRSALANDWADKRRADIPGDTIVLDSKVRPYGDEVPKTIRDLDPVYVAICNDYVFINMGTIPRNGILGFNTNAQQFGTAKLIDGLWLWTRPEGEVNGQYDGK